MCIIPTERNHSWLSLCWPPRPLSSLSPFPMSHSQYLTITLASWAPLFKFFLECFSRFSLDGFSGGDLAGPPLMTLVKVVPHVTHVNHLYGRLFPSWHLPPSDYFASFLRTCFCPSPLECKTLKAGTLKKKIHS